MTTLWPVLLVTVFLACSEAEPSTYRAPPPLHRAAAQGKLVEVRAILAGGAPVDQRSRLRETALMFAARSGHKAIYDALMAHGADVKAVGAAGKSLLVYSAEGGNATIAAALLRAGLPVDARTSAGQTALHMACAKGHDTVVAVLVKAGADVNAIVAREDMDPVKLAARAGALTTVELLVKAGAALRPPGGKHRYERSALMWAARGGHVEVMQALLDSGASVDERAPGGDTALIEASYEGQQGSVRFLLARGAAVDAATREGKTALGAAAHQGHTETMKLLIEAGADVDAKWLGWPVIRHPSLYGHAEAVRLLLDVGVDVNCRVDNRRSTPLITAASHWHGSRTAKLNTVKILLDKGATVDATDSYGCTALIMAAGAGNPGVVAQLLKSGADPNHKPTSSKPPADGETPLFKAIRSGNTQVIRALLEGGASTSAQSAAGLSPLDCANERPRDKVQREIIELLKQATGD